MKKIDDLLINLAKRMIIIASFFGISRYQLTKWWLIITFITFFIRATPENLFISIILSFLIGGLMGYFLMLPIVKRLYREDDILENVLVLVSRKYRVSNLICIFFLSYLFDILNLLFWHAHVYWVILIIKLPSHAFFPYFILNQNTKSKVTLKSLVKGLEKKLGEIMAPKPVPQPVPVRN
ncbi:MAG: hypothetical protein WCV58_04200 [Patescibacteria group bacterium]